MTLSIEPHYIYLGATTVLAVLQILNMRKTDKLKSDIDQIWHQLAVMAIASAGAFDKVQKSLDEKADKEKK